LLQTAIAHQTSLVPQPPGAAPPPAPTVTTTASGADLHIAFDTQVANPAGLVVTTGDPHNLTPPAIRRIPIDRTSGTVAIPGAAADRQAVHVSVAADDGGASPSTQTKPR
jgi:hypothetical protein